MDNNKKIERNSYSDLVTKKILLSSKYKESLKNLSYSYRYNGEDEVFSFISMNREDINESVICVILELYIDSVIEQPRYEQIYEEIEQRIKGWKLDNDIFFDFIRIDKDNVLKLDLINFLKNGIDSKYEETNEYVLFSL